MDFEENVQRSTRLRPQAPAWQALTCLAVAKAKEERPTPNEGGASQPTVGNGDRDFRHDIRAGAQRTRISQQNLCGRHGRHYTVSRCNDLTNHYRRFASVLPPHVAGQNV